MNTKLKEAVRLFNKHEYFACHEIIEDLWREAPDEDKMFYEALIRLSTGFHLRLNRGGTQGSKNLLTQALMRLEDHRPSHLGIDVARLYSEIDSHNREDQGHKSAFGRLRTRWKAPRIHLKEKR